MILSTTEALKKQHMNKIIISCAVFGYDQGVLKVLLTKNDISSNAKWGMVSGLLENAENTDEAADRILNENGIEKKILLRQFKTFVNYQSQPMKNIVTIGYYALVNIQDCKANSSAIASYRRWKCFSQTGDLIFGHSQILDLAFYQFSKSVRELQIMSDLLPEKFTLDEFAMFWKQILGSEIDEETFSKKMLQKRVLVQVQEKQKTSLERFYKFNPLSYERLCRENFIF